MKREYSSNGVEIYQGDCREVLRELPDESVHCVVTSPPYWGLRDYGCDGQVGLEDTLESFIETMAVIFADVQRILRSDGTLWLNLGDSYNSGNKGNSGEMNPNYKQASNAGSLATRRGLMLGGQRNGGANNLCKPKDLCGIPWRTAFALQASGWYLRQDIIWSKPNPMPESVTDRCTKAHEYLFLLSKSERYYFNQEAILEPVSANTHLRVSQNVAAQKGSERANGNSRTDRPMKAVVRSRESWNGSKFDDPRDLEIRPNTGRKRPAAPGSGIKYNDSFNEAVCLPVDARNPRSVWTVPVQGFSEAHFATFPEDLIKPCILAGCPEGGTVLDPFMGSGTTALVARKLHCKAIGIELNPEYIKIAAKRLRQNVLDFSEVTA